VVLQLSGCGLLGVGIWLKTVDDSYSRTLVISPVVHFDYLLISVGVLVFVVAFFGCCGSWFQSRCMLITYFSLVIIMFLLEFIVASLAFVYREDLSETIKAELTDGIKEHYKNPTDNGIEEIWDHVHTRFSCCGVNNYQDWYDIKAWPEKKIVPASCCIEKYRNNTDCWSEGNQDYWYTKGCSEEVLMWFVSQLHIVGIIGLVVSFVQVCYLRIQIPKIYLI
ncbi:hypothetical protein AAG570_003026, partial [Ranatra chinensis]